MPHNSRNLLAIKPGIIGLIFFALIIQLLITYQIRKSIVGVPFVTERDYCFVGRERCIGCHIDEYELWSGSHHDMAMDSAIKGTVLGDFDNFEFEHKGEKHLFYQKGGKYYVNTEGENGKFKDYQVAYTFGYTPLQQYLIPFDGGRFQCLPIVWDTENGRWFHMADTLYPPEELEPHSWLYWTNQAQNWNGMCADCHSTDLKKNFDPISKSFNTTWFEIDVSCEACHGPASNHLIWANIPEGKRPGHVHAGFLSKSKNLDKDELLGICARCHSRRSILGDYTNNTDDLLNTFVPQKLIQPVYYPDGQILDEDYVFASFLQSTMYKNNVKCSDCHNVHSGKLKVRGNKLCLQCHSQVLYDTPEHHFHKMAGDNLERINRNTGKPLYEEGEGAQCVNCHMVGRHYMGIDYRRDHSFRIPRPDLTIELGVPNACTDCHEGQSAQWAQGYVEKWYGKKIPPHFGTVFAAAQNGDASSVQDLCNLATSDLFPVMIRASALVLLGNFNDSLSRKAVVKSLDHTESLIRHSALMGYNPQNTSDFVKNIAPLLNDPVKAIRSDAAFRLLEIYPNNLSDSLKVLFDSALEEYHAINLYNSDFPGGNYNLGNLHMIKGNYLEAEKEYKEAIQIDEKFYRAKVNLALLYNKQGRNSEAGTLLKEVLEDYPDLVEANYSLGLLLAEQEKYESSKTFLLKAYKLMPKNSRIIFNLALLENKLKKTIEAERLFHEALLLDPLNFDYLLGISRYYIEHERLTKAKKYLKVLKENYPQNSVIEQLLNTIEG